MSERSALGADAASLARRRGPLASVAELFVEPARPLSRPSAGACGSDGPQVVVAVVGLRRGCGTTTVARALGAELALRSASGACVALGGAEPPGLSLGVPAALRLSRSLATAFGVRARALGRLCVVASELGDADAVARRTRDLAPVVVDVAAAEGGAVAASLADAVVLVAAPGVEPALADLVGGSLARVGPAPIVVVNHGGRGADAAGRWSGRCALELPASRVGARLALSGREARGDLGRAIDWLAAAL